MLLNVSQAWQQTAANAAAVDLYTQQVAAQEGAVRAPSKVFFMTIDGAKFRRPVGPGDVVEFHMRKLRNRRNMWWFRGEAKVDGTLVAEAEVSAMLVTE